LAGYEASIVKKGKKKKYSEKTPNGRSRYLRKGGGGKFNRGTRQNKKKKKSTSETA